MNDNELALFDEALEHVGDDDDWYESHTYLATVAPPRLRALVAEVRRLREPQEGTWNGVKVTWDNGMFTIGDEPLPMKWRRRRGRGRPEYWNEAEQRWQREPVENEPAR